MRIDLEPTTIARPLAPAVSTDSPSPQHFQLRRRLAFLSLYTPGEGVCALSQYVVLKTLAPAAEQAAMRQEHGERITLFKQADVGTSVISAGDTVRNTFVSSSRDRVCSAALFQSRRGASPSRLLTGLAPQLPQLVQIHLKSCRTQTHAVRRFLCLVSRHVNSTLDSKHGC